MRTVNIQGTQGSRLPEIRILCSGVQEGLQGLSRFHMDIGEVLTKVQEASTGVIDLKEDDPEIVRLMVHYFYHLDYQHQNQSSTVNRVNLSNEDTTNIYVEKDLGHPNLTLHAKVYALGEKYAIAGLKALALRKFREEADVSWDKDEFLRAAKEVYTSTVDHDRSMRQAVVETICRHPELLDKQAAQDAVEGSELCFDVMMKFKKGYQGLFPSVSATKKRLSRFGSAHGPSW